MKKILMLFAVMAIMMGVTNSGLAQTSDNEQNNANAQILGAIALTATQALEFGGIVPHTAASTVVMDYEDGRTIGTGTPTLVTSKVIPKSGAYTVTGTGRVGYVISIPENSFNITNTTGSGGQTMQVSSITCSKGAFVAGSVASEFDADGNDSFKVGATLAVGAGQAFGLYTGHFHIIAAY